MFATVKRRVALLDKYLEYVQAAKEMEGLGYILNDREYKDYSEYYRDMKETCDRCIKGLKENSTDQRLIDRMEQKVSDMFMDINF